MGITMQRLIVDRIENGLAVCETENLPHIEIPLEQLPGGTAEGSIIIVRDDGSYELDEKAMLERRQLLLQKQRSLFKKKND